jgi:uncharacterized protein
MRPSPASAKLHETADRPLGPLLAERSREPFPRRDSLRALALAPQRELHQTLGGVRKMPTARQVLEHAFRETAKANGRLFVDMLTDEVEWSIIGPTEWSEVFRRKSSVITNLLHPLAEQFEGPNTMEATRFIAEGNLVAVEGRNFSVTRRGRPIPTVLLDIRNVGREGVRITEYCDTALVDRVLVRPRK